MRALRIGEQPPNEAHAIGGPGSYSGPMNAILLALAAGLLWGVGEVCTRSVLHTKSIGPLAAIAMRSTIALPAIWLAYVVATRAIGLDSEPRTWAGGMSTKTWVLLIGGSGLAAGAGAMICFYGALSLGEVSRIKPVAFATAPAVAVLLGWLLLGEAMSGRKALAIMLILAGVVLLTGSPKPASVTPELADSQPTEAKPA